ncbi:hypothetical protein NUSPORA_02263 [Nucleospora cyclopteri]
MQNKPTKLNDSLKNDEEGTKFKIPKNEKKDGQKQTKQPDKLENSSFNDHIDKICDGKGNKTIGFLFYIFNMLMITLLLINTEYIFDCTVTYNYIGLGFLIIAFLPLFFLGVKKRNLFKVGVLSVFLTALVLLYLFITRVTVTFYKFNLDEYGIKYSDMNKIVNTHLEIRAFVLDDMLKNELLYPIARDPYKNVKIILFHSMARRTGGTELLKNDLFTKLMKEDLRKETTGVFTVISAVLGLDWSSPEEEKRVLKVINTTRFSNRHNYYAEFIGFFDLNKLENREQITRKMLNFEELQRKIVKLDNSKKANYKTHP